VARAEDLAVVLRWLPTFLYVHVMDAHGPYRPLPPFDRVFDARPYGKADEERNRRASPPFLENETFAEPPVERAGRIGIERLATLYDGSLRYVDEQLGRLLATLEERGLLGNTAVLLTADHGEEFLDHDLTYHDSVPHEEKVRVPLIVKPHAGFAGAQTGRIERPVDAVLGVLPTLLALAGVPAPAELHGESLFAASAAEGPIFHDNDWIRAVRAGPWKLIVVGEEGRTFPEIALRQSPAEMLFRLDTDPAERVDLRAQEPAKADELRRLLEERFAPIEAAAEARASAPGAPAVAPAESAPDAPGAVDATRRERLRALGYVP
jgi:arylsulfatase A-like enzyme